LNSPQRARRRRETPSLGDQEQGAQLIEREWVRHGVFNISNEVMDTIAFLPIPKMDARAHTHWNGAATRRHEETTP
jgi:hypothetical protein